MIPAVELEMGCYEQSRCPNKYLHRIQRDASQALMQARQPLPLQPLQSCPNDDFGDE